MRLAYYAGASATAAAVCLLKAFHQRPNFYSATVYLSQSNACLLILTNLLLMLAGTFIYGLQRLLYGPLRPIEIEQLSEKAWYAVLDTLLAMPSFREDVGGWLLTMFVLLLAGKVWGWIGEGRVDILEQQPPTNPRLFHARLATSLIVSMVFDLAMLKYCVETVMADPRPGMMVIFTFEFAIQSIFAVFTFSRYLLSVAELFIQKKQLKIAIETRKLEIIAERAAAAASETGTTIEDGPIEVDENEVEVPGWEDKRRYLFALEVLNDFVKLLVYIVFFTVSITFNGLPMHIMRDVYMTFASFSKRVTDYIAYRKATSDMNTRYPDATTEEIQDDACIVCRETMVAWTQPVVPGEGQPAAPTTRRDEGLRAKKLPCGHILHLRCLKAWLERQQVCPTCRRPVVTASNDASATAAAAAAAAAAGGRVGAPAAGVAGVPLAAQPQGAANVPGAPGARPAVPDQRPQQNRARIFNLGPIRIGFLNGPGDQIQNMINQMRNGQQAAPPIVPAPQADHAGSNHPALQYPTQQAPGALTTGVPSQAGASTQIQLLQIEQRLMQEAMNLATERQQLYTLRHLEAELARLRAMHISNQAPVGTSTAVQRQLASMTATGGTQELRGNTSRQYGAGYDMLPAGLVLPEGWSITPLTRTTPGSQSATVQQDNAGPTDDSGSPLFVPTSTMAANTDAAHDAPGQGYDDVRADATAIRPTGGPATTGTELRKESTSPGKASSGIMTGPQETTASPSPEARQSSDGPVVPEGGTAEASPWASGDWGFDGPSAAATSANGHGEALSSTQDKGKGRAAEVEDAPEAES